LARAPLLGLIAGNERVMVGSANNIEPVTRLTRSSALAKVMVEIGRRIETLAAYDKWADAISRKPGQLGGAITQCMAGRQIGNKVELAFDDNFLPTLQASGIPYDAVPG
jgi:hypothetical protein